jgi:hypothetical protein
MKPIDWDKPIEFTEDAKGIATVGTPVQYVGVHPGNPYQRIIAWNSQSNRNSYATSVAVNTTIVRNKKVKVTKWFNVFRAGPSALTFDSHDAAIEHMQMAVCHSKYVTTLSVEWEE